MGWDKDWDGNSDGTGVIDKGDRGNANGATDANAREFGTFQQVISEGPIFGLVDGLKSVYLDGTPILSSTGSKNLSGVALALTSGTNTQGMIPGFMDVQSETSVNVKVSVAGGAVTRTVSTAGISAIRVRIGIPALKVVNATDGSERGTAVQVKIERQSPSYNGGAWENVTLEGTGRIQDKFGTKYTKGYRIETPAAGPWSIRVTRLTPDHVPGAPDYTQDETWWDAYTEITDAKLRHPFTALAALKVDAKQFRQIPKLTMDLKGRLVQIPSNYNPTTRAYTGLWDGTFTTAWTDNPAWIWYDLAINTRYGAGTFLDAGKIDKWSLYAIAQACDVLVSDGKGGQEPRFRCSLYLQNQEEAIKLLQEMASIFRGMIYWAGGTVTAVQDMDSTSFAAIFTNSNVKEGRFSYQGTARKSRHTAALVSWQDPNNGYESAVEYVEDHSAIARYGFNPTTIAALGATSQAQARRLGLWTLLTETLGTEALSFSAGLEGSTLRPGDVIAVRDQFRGGRLGGRILAGATTTVVPLDAPVTLPVGTNVLSVRLPDGTVEQRNVTTGAGVTSSLTVSPAFSVAPVYMAQWALNVSLYRVLGIKKGDGLYYEVAALQHVPSKYASVDGVTVTPRPVKPESPFTPPGGLTLSDTVRIEKDKLVQTLSASWVSSLGALYRAEASQDYGPWQPMVVSAASASLDGVTPGAWRVRVLADYGSGTSDWVTATRTVATPTQTATDASAAQADATAALNKISDASSDGLITDLERPGLKTLRASLALAVSSAQTQANTMGVGHSALDSVWSTLTTNVDPILTATGNSAITKATWDGWWSAVYQEVQNLQGVLSNTAKNAAAYADALSRSPNNLIKNGNSEEANPTGYEAALLDTGAGANAYGGTKTRTYLRSAASNSGVVNVSAPIPCILGDQFYMEAWCKSQTGSNQHIGLRFLDASLGLVAYGVPSDVTSTTYAKCSGSFTAPAGTSFVQFFIEVNGGPDGYCWFDAMYACRKVAAGMLEVDLGIFGVLRSGGGAGSGDWVAGSTGNAPQGFKLSGTKFTTTFKDGTTDANCQMELGGTANINGYKVDGLTNRAMTAYNRINNGGFYGNLVAGWTVSGSLFQWDANRSAGAGSALLFKPTGATFARSDDLFHPFTTPPTLSEVNLTLDTGFSTTGGFATEGGTVRAYLYNGQTDTETLLATWTYSSASPQALAWTSRSVNITSYVASGGFFTLRLTATTNAGHTDDTVSIHICNVKIII